MSLTYNISEQKQDRYFLGEHSVRPRHKHKLREGNISFSLEPQKTNVILHTTHYKCQR